MGTVIVSALLLCLIALIIYKLYKDRKNGKICAGCEYRNCCPKAKKM